MCRPIGIIAMLLGLACLVSCGEGLEESDTKEQELVFGDRDIDQVRGELLNATALNSIPADPLYLAQQATAQRALSARATGQVTPELRCGGTNEGSSGTGFMTSDSRMVTAAHVVGGMLRTFDPAKPNERGVATVRFEGTNGNFVADTQTGYQGPEDDSFRLDVTEENPLLANRLFGMGIDNWARSDALSVRERLRTWNFIVDENPGGPSFAGQGLLDLIPGTEPYGAFDGYDMVVLKASPQTDQVFSEENEEHRAFGGPFSITKPGAFFDQLRVHRFEDEGIWNSELHESRLSESESKLGMVHVNRWGDDWENNHSPLVSSHGVYWGRHGQDLSKNSCPNASADSFNSLATGLHRHSLDSREGSSGGAVLAQLDDQYPDGGIPLLADKYRVVGVNQGNKTGDLNLEGVGWNLANTGLSENSYAPAESADPTNTYTEIIDVSFPNRDLTGTGGTPFSPIPVTFSFDVEAPCAEFDENEKCVRRADGKIEENEDQRPDCDPASEICITKRPAIEVDRSKDVPHLDERLYECGFNALGTSYISGEDNLGGVVVGFIGGETPEGNIGSLRLICAPHTGVAHLINWRFLTTIGTRVPIGMDSTAGPFGIQTVSESRRVPLRFTLVDSYERRDGDVRPISMKMCPPYYAVKGVAFFAAQTGEGDMVVKGISSLICEKMVEEYFGTQVHGPSTVQLQLSAPAGDYDYTFGGEAWTLDQRIGNPSAGTTVIYRSCSSGYLLDGLHMDYDSTGNLVYADQSCIRSPVP